MSMLRITIIISHDIIIIKGCGCRSSLVTYPMFETSPSHTLARGSSEYHAHVQEGRQWQSYLAVPIAFHS